MTNKNNSRFQKTSFNVGPTYICISCGKRTRETGYEESSCQLCAFCFRESLLYNSLMDNCITEVDYTEEVKKLKKQYKRKFL